MEAIEKIKAGIAEINKKKAELTEQLRKDFPEILKPLFDKSDKINSIGWTQYTPYFNDGDSCEFCTHFDDLYINGEYQDDIDALDWRIGYYLKGDERYKFDDSWDLDMYKVVEEFKDVLNSIDDEFYLDLFGDHVKVTINRYGTVETEEYKHD